MMRTLNLVDVFPGGLLFDRARHGLRWLAGHSGVPVVVVAAVLLVVSFRIFKKVVRVAVEVAIVAVLLVVATKLGWLRW